MADNDANINDAAAVFTIIVLWPMNPNKSHYFTRMHATLWLRIHHHETGIIEIWQNKFS